MHARVDMHARRNATLAGAESPTNRRRRPVHGRAPLRRPPGGHLCHCVKEAGKQLASRATSQLL